MAKRKGSRRSKRRDQFPPIGPPTYGTIKVERVRSAIGTKDQHKDALNGLGLRRIGHVVEREDTPAIRGQIARILHLVRIVSSKDAG